MGFSANAVVGWAKSTPNNEPVSWIKAVPTVFIGAGVGAVASGLNMDIASVETVAAAYGAVAVVNAAWIFVAKTWFKVQVSMALKKLKKNKK